MHFISTASSGTKRFYLVHDPRIPIRHLIDSKKIDERELFEIDDLLKDLGQPPIELSVETEAAPATQAPPFMAPQDVADVSPES